MAGERVKGGKKEKVKDKEMTETELNYYCSNAFTTDVYVVVQFYPWFNFYFPLFQTHYHILPCPKTKENKN